jgi:high-affinity Fe2+/Pb2+ permease
LAALGLGTLVLAAALATMLFDDPPPTAARIVVGTGLLATLGLGVGASWLGRRNQDDDRFHAGMLLALAVALGLAATAIGVFSSGLVPDD